MEGRKITISGFLESKSKAREVIEEAVREAMDIISEETGESCTGISVDIASHYSLLQGGRRCDGVYLAGVSLTTTLSDRV